jgi:hypothetical protein
MKRALLIGINYIGSSCELNGCVNDTINIKNLLINSFHYKPENIILLDDAGTNPLKPTKENILLYLNKVVNATHTGDTLFIHYSGHGAQVDDINGDEIHNADAPGMDSVLCPCDYDKYSGVEGFILDDTLKEIINRLPKGSKLRMFSDCCHGATMLDLPYIYKNGGFTKVEALCDGTDDIITISGSHDSQTSADAYINGQYSGALTFGLLKTLANVNKVPTTWLLLLTVVQHYLASEQYTQIPVLCAGNKGVLKQRIDL